MKTGLSLLYLGPAVLVVIAASVFVGVLLFAGRGRLTYLAYPVQERVVMAAAWAPATAGFLALGFGLVDLWVLAGSTAACLQAAPILARHSFLLPLVCGGLLARALIAGSRIAVDLWRSRQLTRAFRDLAPATSRGYSVLPIERPQAIVLGLVQPRVYLSQGLLEAVTGDELAVVLAHEQAHVERREPLRRALTSVGLLFHLPGIARLIEQELTRTQEITADAAAARLVGDPMHVAEALVRFGRFRSAGPAAVEFSSGHLESRVRELLDPRPHVAGPSRPILVVILAVLCVVSLLAAHPLHVLNQMLLRMP
jgi:Zn-dependent protease with chaperone function